MRIMGVGMHSSQRFLAGKWETLAKTGEVLRFKTRFSSSRTTRHHFRSQGGGSAFLLDFQTPCSKLLRNPIRPCDWACSFQGLGLELAEVSAGSMPYVTSLIHSYLIIVMMVFYHYVHLAYSFYPKISHCKSQFVNTIWRPDFNKSKQ